MTVLDTWKPPKPAKKMHVAEPEAPTEGSIMAGEIEEADKVIKQSIIQRFTKENADVQKLLENMDLV